MMLKRNFYVVLFLTFMLSGCFGYIHQGPSFKLEESTVPDKAKVYVYWDSPNGLVHAQDFTIEANDKPIRTMIQGGYFVHYAPEGRLLLTSPANFAFGSMGILDLALTTTEELSIDVKAGESYFVSCAMAGFRGQRRLPMALVPNETGLSRIKTTKLLPDDSKELKAAFAE